MMIKLARICQTCKHRDGSQCLAKGIDLFNKEVLECEHYLEIKKVDNPIMDQAKAVLELQQHGDTMQTMGIMTGGFIAGLRKAGISDEIILQVLPVYFRTVLKIKGE